MRLMDQETGLLLMLQEFQWYLSLKARSFEHMSILDPSLLQWIGMNLKFIIVLASIGCIFSNKYGIKLLTLEFLSTLQTQQDGIYFRMFNQDFSLTWSA